MPTFHYIIRNERGGIIQKELEAKTDNAGRLKLAFDLTPPFEIMASMDVTLDHAIKEVQALLKKRERKSGPLTGPLAKLFD